MKSGIGAAHCQGYRVLALQIPDWKISAVVAFIVASSSFLRAADPTLLGKYPSSGSSPDLFYGVALSGGDAYTVTYGYTNANGALRVLAGTSPPVQTAATGAIDGFRKVEMGSAAYVLWGYSAAGNWRSGVRIFNRSTLAEYDTDGRLFWIGTRAQGFDLAANILYIGSDDGLITVDVTDPDVEPGIPTSGPRVLGTCTNITTGYDVDVVGSLAYVADGTAGLKILDISAPEAPTLLGTWLPGAGQSVRGVFVDAAAIAHVVGEGFWAVDVSVSNTPVTLGSLEEDADRVVVANGFAYLAGYGGLRVYNVSEPTAITLDGRYMTPYRAEDVAYAAPFVYLADRSGLFVLQHGMAPALVLILTAAPDAGGAPLDVRFTGEVTGGTPPYFYDWFINGQLVYSGEESFLDHTFDTAEAHVARATVTDASGKVASAAAEVDARGPKGRIYGTVRTAGSGEPIGNASLTVQGPAGVFVAADTVNPAGEYSFARLTTGIYRLTASAPDHEPATTVVALRPGQNQRVDFNLAAILTEGAKQKKGTLINEISQFPNGARDWAVGDIIGWINSGGTPAAPALEHAYADAEQLTATWLAQQTNLTEALQRITLAEGAFKLMADDAAIYANYAAEYCASAMGNTLDMMICLFQLDEFIEKKLWFSDIQGMLIKKYADALSFDLFLKLAQWTGERSTLAARTIFKESLNEIIGAMADEAEIDINVNQFVLDWKARFENYWARALIQEYARTTEPLLTTSLDRAIAGPPYELDYEDSKAIVLSELRATAAKRELVVRHQNNIDYVTEEIAGAGISTFGWLTSVIDACGECLPEAGLAHLTELAFRSLQIYGEAGNVQMALDRLRTGLPQEAANAVYWSFGATPPTFPPPDSGGAAADPDRPILERGASEVAGISSMSLPMPSSAAARAMLATAHGQLEAGGLVAYAVTLTNGVIPEMDAYIHDAGIFDTASSFQLDPASPELKELGDHLGWCRDSYHFVLGASLELIMHEAAGNPPDAPDAVALRERLLDQIATLIATLDETDGALRAADFATTDLPDPGPILAITRLSATNEVGRPFLPSVAGQTIGVTAEVINVGSSNAAGVEISLVLTNGSNLSLASGSLTVPLPPLPAGATSIMTWTLTCNVAGSKRFELLACSLAHSGTDLGTTLPQGESFLVVPGPYYTDSDGDGISDTFETENGLDPDNTADAQSDADGDGLSALDEFLNHTNPNAPDTDGDGCSDPDEIAGGYNPFNPTSRPVPAPDCDQLEIGMFDAAGTRTPLLIARLLKPDPETPITIQGSSNLIDWEEILVYTNGTSAASPAVYQSQEFDGHYELLFDVPGLQPTLPRAAFYRMQWEVPPEPPPATVRITANTGDDLQPGWHPSQQKIAFITCREPYPTAPNLGLVLPNGTNEHAMATGPTQGTNGLVHSLCWRGASWPHMPEVLVEERVSTHEYLEFLPDADPWTRTQLDYSDGAFDRRLRIDGGGAGGCIRGSRDGSTIAWRYSTSADGTGNIALRAGPLDVFGQLASSYGTAFLTSNSSTGELLNCGFGLNANGTVAVVSRRSGTGRDLFLHNTNGTGTPVQLTTSGQATGALNEWPEFSPNGTRIAFTFRESSASHSDIAIIQLNGSGFVNVTRSPNWTESHPTWSPDGATIAFQRYDDASTPVLQPGESPNWNIHVIAAP